MKVLTAGPGVSYARVDEPTDGSITVGAVQHRWHPDPDEHRAALAEGVRLAVDQGARLVCLQELTLSSYFAVTPDGPRPGVEPEPLEGGRVGGGAGHQLHEPRRGGEGGLDGAHQTATSATAPGTPRAQVIADLMGDT